MSPDHDHQQESKLPPYIQREFPLAEATLVLVPMAASLHGLSALGAPVADAAVMAATKHARKAPEAQEDLLVDRGVGSADAADPLVNGQRVRDLRQSEVIAQAREQVLRAQAAATRTEEPQAARPVGPEIMDGPARREQPAPVLVAPVAEGIVESTPQSRRMPT
jgi:hypothetical protein